MKIYLNTITGIPSAITSMYMSKRTWTREKELYIRKVCSIVNDENGKMRETQGVEYLEQYNKWLDSLIKWGIKHNTLLRFITFDITVEGMHRGGEDDWDSHAKRFDNRIIRSSTRLAKFGNETSDYYKNKIIPTDVALAILGLSVPEKITYNDQEYVKSTNGYVLSDYADNQDTIRGLYMLSIPCNFIFQIDLFDFCHVYRERGNNGSAHPEVKELAEGIADQVSMFQTKITRKLFMEAHD